MKRFLAFALLSSWAALSAAQDLDAVLREIQAINRFSETYSATLRIASYSPDAPVALASYRMFAKGMRKVLLVFVEPPKDAGKKIAMNGDAMWFYFPKARQSLLVRPASTLTGSVSVGDMIGSPTLDLYGFESAEKLPDGGGLALTFAARGPASPYGKIVYEYRGGRIASQRSYTRSGILLKITSYVEYARSALGGDYATKVKIQNAVYPEYYSLIQVSDMRKADAMPDFYFTPEGLADAGTMAR